MEWINSRGFTNRSFPILQILQKITVFLFPLQYHVVSPQTVISRVCIDIFMPREVIGNVIGSLKAGNWA